MRPLLKRRGFAGLVLLAVLALASLSAAQRIMITPGGGFLRVPPKWLATSLVWWNGVLPAHAQPA